MASQMGQIEGLISFERAVPEMKARQDPSLAILQPESEILGLDAIIGTPAAARAITAARRWPSQP